MPVTIQGGGVAAWCCAQLLKRARITFDIEAPEESRVPALMLSTATQHLLKDIFETQDLFTGSHMIRRRVVVWGSRSEPAVLPHSAIVMPEQILIDRLAQASAYRSAQSHGDWILTTRRSPATEFAWGERTATAYPVLLENRAGNDACWIESTGEGWLFLLPSGGLNAWLLSIGNPAVLDSSRLIANQLASIGEPSATFPAHPRITNPLHGPRWLACGAAAMAFDPICGDGAGNAARESILATAVIRASRERPDDQGPAEHYSARLLAGFQRHLENCLRFYQTGPQGHWWTDQAKALETGLAWCRAHSSAQQPFRYRLNGFTLEPL
jgi:hypothetical protein